MRQLRHPILSVRRGAAALVVLLLPFMTVMTALWPAPVSAATAVGATSWFFAEGYTGTGFDEYLTIMNPGAAATATIIYYIEGRSTPEQRTVPLPASSRTTVIVHQPQSSSNPGGLGRLSFGHSTRVESDLPVVVERPMYFTYGGSVTDGHNVLGARGPAYLWYFAEGYTGTGFDEYLTIMNPGAVGTATVTYYVEGAVLPEIRTVSLAASSRTTVAVHENQSTNNPGGLGRLTVGHSTKIESTVPIVVERPMYFRYGVGGAITGGHNAMGARTLASEWLFAEGYTGPGFDEYLTIANPGGPGLANVTYYVEGQPSVGPLVVPLAANSRTTIAVHSAASAGNPGGLGRKTAGHSTRVTTTVPVVIERPMYFTYGTTVTGGHNVIGATSARTSWLFGEGYTGAGFDEYLTIMNANASVAPVTITYYLDGAAPQVKIINVPAASRYTVQVHGTSEGVGRGQAVSAQVETTLPAGIVVERPMYFSYGPGGAVTGGHNVMGYSVAETDASYRAAVLADGAASYWRLGELSGTTAADELSAVPGTYSDGTMLAQPGAIGGTSDRSATMAGGKVEMGDVYDFSARAPFTLEIWAYPTLVNNDYQRLISKESIDVTVTPFVREGYTLGFSRQEGLFCGRYVGTVHNEVIAAPGLIFNTWNHVVCTYDGTFLTLYLNGAQVGNQIVSTISLANTTLPLTLGQKTYGANVFGGRLDEAAIYPAALSATRVAQHYLIATQ